MDDFKTDKAIFTAHDFLLWQENGIFEITPKFQRRSVWRTPARSYFIDTLLREMMVPPLYFRMTQNSTKTKVVREVVDGQQRVRSVLDFIAEQFKLSTNLNAPWAGHSFSQLSGPQQESILSFGFPVEIFKGISDQQVLEVFCRLNMNGVPLNKQELRNGRFFGRFKQTSYDLALRYLEFWRQHKIFTELRIARMLEVELTSELLIASHTGSVPKGLVPGMQDKKSSLDDFYEHWENSYPSQQIDERRFNETMNTISETFANGDLASSEFRHAPLFYTLFCVVNHHIFGMARISRTSPKKRLTGGQRESLRDAVIRLSEVIAESRDPAGDVPKKFAGFVLACQRQTDNILPRRERFDTLFAEAF